MTAQERKAMRPIWGMKGAAIRWKDLPSFEIRFWKRVKKANPDECWPWVGRIGSAGYGSLYTKAPNSKHRNYKLSHRIAWELTYGPIPDGLFVCHKCDNRRCCNPNHLFVGTAKDNMQDAFDKGRLPMFVVNGQKQIGETHRCAKLKSHQIIQIREQYRNGIDASDLSKAYGVHRNTINDVVICKTWKHV